MEKIKTIIKSSSIDVCLIAITELIKDKLVSYFIVGKWGESDSGTKFNSYEKALKEFEKLKNEKI